MGRGRKNYGLLKRQGQVGNRKCHMERSRSFRGRFITTQKFFKKCIVLDQFKYLIARLYQAAVGRH